MREACLDFQKVSINHPVGRTVQRGERVETITTETRRQHRIIVRQIIYKITVRQFVRLDCTVGIHTTIFRRVKK